MSGVSLTFPGLVSLLNDCIARQFSVAIKYPLSEIWAHPFAVIIIISQRDRAIGFIQYFIMVFLS
jgi:hypothetical protein